MSCPDLSKPQQYLKSKTVSMGAFSNRKMSLSPTELRLALLTIWGYPSAHLSYTFQLLSWSLLQMWQLYQMCSFFPGVGQRCACLSSEHTGGEVVLHCLCWVYAKDVYDSQGMWQLYMVSEDLQGAYFCETVHQWGPRRLPRGTLISVRES